MWHDQETANQKACSNYGHNCPIKNDLLLTHAKQQGFVSFKHTLLFSFAQTINTEC